MSQLWQAWTHTVAKMCQSKPLYIRNSQPVHNVTDNSSDSEYQLFVVHVPNSNPLKTTLLVERHQLTMEIDTGAAVSLVSEETVNSSFMKDLPLHPTDVRLRTTRGRLSRFWGK